MQHVIIGAGAAGVMAAESIRKYDGSSTVTLVGEERERPYSRMAIPYYLVGQIGEEGTYLRKHAGHYAALGIDVRRGRVQKVDTSAALIELEDGGRLVYDRLLIAAGSRPVTLPIPGVDLPGVVNCWTLEDARKIAKFCRPGNQLVLIGAGFIGCIILEALARSGVDLTVVEAENRMVPRMMNETSGGLIKRWCEGKGVVVKTSARVQAIERSGASVGSSQGKAKRLQVALETGEILNADMVISATGVKPSTAFLDGSGIKIDKGVLVDARLRTNAPNVFAAGDVCQGLDFSTGGYAVQAIQPTATEHGRIAAANMTGLNLTHPGCLNMNVLDTMGLISSSFGLWMGVHGGDSAVLEDHARYRYLNLQFEGDVLVGASSLGLTNHIGVLRGLIQSRTQLKAWKQKLIKDPTRIMEAYLAANHTLQPASS
jgi:NAD(P)H-nitrite reductase large subunit